MSRENPGALPLFDLLARQWRLPAPAASIYFDAHSRALAASLIDGRVALIATEDAEPPERRIAVDEAGRRTITPRRGEPKAAIVLAARGEGAALVAPAWDEGFAIIRGDGGLSRVAPNGEETALAPVGSAVALACGEGDVLTIVTARGVEVRDRAGGKRSGGADWGAHAVAVSLDGSRLAFGCGESLVVAKSEAPLEIERRYACPGRVERIVWRDDGAWLVATCGAGGLALLDLRGDRFAAIGGFPTPPRSAAFSKAANALVASGAFRIVAWDLARPPFEGDRAGALETGRPGLVPIVEIATLPRRKLAAAAYANGQIVVAELGLRDEMILQAAGPEPTALAASADGRTLAIAAGDCVSLVSLPDAMFK